MKSGDPHKIVILDEDLHRRNYLRSVVCEKGAVPYFFDNAAICLDNVAPISPDLVIAGSLSRQQAYRLILSLKLRDRQLPVVVFTGDSEVHNFVRQNDFRDVSVLGADSEPWELEGALGNLVNQQTSPRLPGETAPPAVIGHSAAMQRLKKGLEAVCPLDDSVFVRGEPGTGKELIARFIYHHSNRCGRPFAKIDLPELLQSVSCETFFDNRPAPGRNGSLGEVLAAVAGGVLLLDNIEALPPDYQAGFLGFLEGDAAAGGRGEGASSVRLIVTGADSIEQLVHDGRFRRDLYFRISSIAVALPPLRERTGDVSLLADYFADQCCIDIGRGHFDLTAEFKELLEGYPWPGNVRELKGAVRMAVIAGNEQVVQKKMSDLIRRGGIMQTAADAGPIDRLADFSGLRAYLKTQRNLSLKNVCQTYVDRIEKKLIKRTLERTKWNRREAARMLDISYKSILNKIKRYKLDAPPK